MRSESLSEPFCCQIMRVFLVKIGPLVGWCEFPQNFMYLFLSLVVASSENRFYCVNGLIREVLTVKMCVDRCPKTWIHKIICKTNEEENLKRKQDGTTLKDRSVFMRTMMYPIQKLTIKPGGKRIRNTRGLLRICEPESWCHCCCYYCAALLYTKTGGGVLSSSYHLLDKNLPKLCHSNIFES